MEIQKPTQRSSLNTFNEDGELDVSESDSEDIPKPLIRKQQSWSPNNEKLLMEWLKYIMDNRFQHKGRKYDEVFPK